LGAWNSQTETDSVIAQVLLPQEIQLKLNACDTKAASLKQWSKQQEEAGTEFLNEQLGH